MKRIGVEWKRTNLRAVPRVKPIIAKLDRSAKLPHRLGGRRKKHFIMKCASAVVKRPAGGE